MKVWNFGVKSIWTHSAHRLGDREYITISHPGFKIKTTPGSNIAKAVSYLTFVMSSMAILVVQFHGKVTKLDYILAKNQHNWGKILYILLIDIVPSCQKVPKSDFRNKFGLSKMIWISIEQYLFRSTFYDNFNFETLYFLKWCPIFDYFIYLRNTLISFRSFIIFGLKSI